MRDSILERERVAQLNGLRLGALTPMSLLPGRRGSPRPLDEPDVLLSLERP